LRKVRLVRSCIRINNSINPHPYQKPPSRSRVGVVEDIGQIMDESG
jgi:hypothetical protein